MLEVTWRDSATDTESWSSEDEATSWLDDDVLIQTVGYFFGANKTSLLLAMSRGDEEVGGLWSIPLACVTKIRRLSLSRS
jgi:hypothetical protein